MVSVPTLAEELLSRKLNQIRLSIPVSPGVAAELLLPQPMSEDDWEQFMAVLEAMKPGIVKEAPDPDPC